MPPLQEQIDDQQAQIEKLIDDNESLQKDYNELKDLFYRFVQIDRYEFEKDVLISGVITSTSPKIGFFSKTPAAQQAAIASPTGGGTIDTQARTAIDAIRNVLINFGFTLP